jgi:hypothetical protein
MQREKETAMKRLIAISAAAVWFLACAGLMLAQNDAFVGSWKLDVEKSKFDPGPAPKNQTRVWESSGKVSVESINAAGKHMSYGYTIKTDGSAYPTTGAIPNGADTIATKRLTSNAVEANFQRAGKGVETTNFTVSKNGKVLTIDARGSTPNGQAFHNVTVWDKQ